jgi:hypothetical protein
MVSGYTSYGTVILSSDILRVTGTRAKISHVNVDLSALLVGRCHVMNGRVNLNATYAMTTEGELSGVWKHEEVRVQDLLDLRFSRWLLFKLKTSRFSTNFLFAVSESSITPQYHSLIIFSHNSISRFVENV